MNKHWPTKRPWLPQKPWQVTTDGEVPLGWMIASFVLLGAIVIGCMVVDCHVSGTTWGL